LPGDEGGEPVVLRKGPTVVIGINNIKFFSHENIKAALRREGGEKEV